MNREKSFWGWGVGGGVESVCGRAPDAVTDKRSIFTDTPLVQTAFTSGRTNSPYCKRSVLAPNPPPAPAPHRRPVPRDKAQVEVDKRCLWIFCVTHSNRRLRSPCNYLLTELIPAVKWPAKSMCTQTAAESEAVHAVYLPAPSRP